MKKYLLGLLVFFSVINSVQAQTSTVGSSYISTAVPFLTITPDSRAAGMGDVGVATTPDANSQHWNTSKYVFIEKQVGFSASYTPWLKEITDNMNLGYISGYYKISDLHVISSSIRYFSLGEITLVDENNQNSNLFTPNEFAIDLGYSRKLTDELSLGVTFRYIRSNLFKESSGNSFAVDISCFYNKQIQDDNLGFGLVISNVGSKMSYFEGEKSYFLPANLRLGTSYLRRFSDVSKLSVSIDFNKILVEGGKKISNNNTSGTIYVGGVQSNENVLGSLVSSLDNFDNITYSLGFEYIYNDQIAIRTGYFSEKEVAGNRKYITTGFGLNYKDINFDLAYLIPRTSNNPLKNTIRFSVGYSF